MPAALFGLPYPQPTAMGFLPWLREYYHSPATPVTHSRAVETRGRIREPGFDHVHVSSATNGHGIPPTAAGILPFSRHVRRTQPRGGNPRPDSRTRASTTFTSRPHPTAMGFLPWLRECDGHPALEYHFISPLPLPRANRHPYVQAGIHESTP